VAEGCDLERPKAASL